MERNDIDCRKCGTSIFNGLFHWMFAYAYRCDEQEKEWGTLPDIAIDSDEYFNARKKLPHAGKTIKSQDFNGYFFCPECAKDLGFKCDICGKELTRIEGYEG